MTTLSKAARAVAVTEMHEKSFDDEPEYREACLDVARAVLMAVRETEEVETWDAGRPVHFTAVIDAILSEEA